MKKIILLFSLLLVITFADAQLSGYYKESFEETTFPPLGWITDTSTEHGAWKHDLTNAHGGIKGAYSRGKPNARHFLRAPMFTVKAGDSLTFWTANPDAVPQLLFVHASMQPDDFIGDTIATPTQLVTSWGNWVRNSLSLLKYAGKSIYITFESNVPIGAEVGDSLQIDDVTIGVTPPKDISVMSTNLSLYLPADSTIVPKATFQNDGSQTQTFNVTLTAGTYASTRTVNTLPSLNTQQITFDKLKLPHSPVDLVFTVYSSLANDAYTADDTIQKKCSVIKAFDNYGWMVAPRLPLNGGDHTTYHTGTDPNDSILFSTQYEFNLKTKKFKWLKPGPEDFFPGGAFIYKGKIYYIGGTASKENIDSLENDAGEFSGGTFDYSVDSTVIYDIATDTWRIGSPAPVPISDYAGCQYHDSLYYIIGGGNHLLGYSSPYSYIEYSNIYDTVFIYNAASDKWMRANAFPQLAAPGISAGLANNTIVAFGNFYVDTGRNFSPINPGVIDGDNPYRHQAFTGTINPDDLTKIEWKPIEYYSLKDTFPYSFYGYFENGAVGVNSPDKPMVYFTSYETYAYNLLTGSWEKGPDNPTFNYGGRATFIPLILYDTLYLANIGGNFFTSSNFDSVSDVWLKIGAATSTVLAERFVSFTATLQNDKTALNWKVSEDGLGGYYIIQRAADAVHFADISLRTNAGKASGVKSYTGYDELPLKGYNYYRIKTVSADGSVSYSAIKAVNNISLSSITASIYPNPTHGLLNVVLQNNNGSDAIISIAISDIAGRRIINENKTVNGSLNLSYNLKPGTYVVNLSSKDGTFKQSRKVVVE